MGNNLQTEKVNALTELKETGKVEVNTIKIHEALQDAVIDGLVTVEKVKGLKKYTLTEDGISFVRSMEVRAKIEDEQRRVQEGKLLEEELKEIQEQKRLKTMKEDIKYKILGKLDEESGSFIDIENINTHECVQELLDIGYIVCEVIEDQKHYVKTKKGADWHSFREFKEQKDVEYEIDIKESYIKVSYKKKHDELDLIESVTDKFLLTEDGIPVLRVEPSAYKSLLDRNRNEHWSRYVGLGGSKLIKQKKLKRFYVENTENKRRYLYIVPQD